MCGRFALDDDGTAVAEHFQLAAVPQLAPRFNIAPTQPIAAIVHMHSGARQMTHFVWGLIPSWAKDPAIGSRMINARGETAHEKPSFRAAFKRRRCIVPMTGFFEWQKLPDGKKQPLYIHPAAGKVFGAAGLYEHWQSPDGSEIESCTIITTTPNAKVAPIHNRMPVILDPADYDTWLDISAPLPAVQSLLQPISSEAVDAYPVSTLVNRPANDTPECILPLAA